MCDLMNNVCDYSQTFPLPLHICVRLQACICLASAGERLARGNACLRVCAFGRLVLAQGLLDIPAKDHVAPVGVLDDRALETRRRHLGALEHGAREISILEVACAEKESEIKA